ncbi:MAG: DUF4253 domain-containing protein [Clostridiales bacterium]|nr:DUF4253 domain-containing protein [Clostridiales bacterium]
MSEIRRFTDGMDALEAYLDCRCTCFEPMLDDDPITQAFQEAQQRGAREGFVPVLITPNDTLWETLVMNSDPDSGSEEGYAFCPERVADYRREILSQVLSEGNEMLEQSIRLRREEADEDGLDWENGIVGVLEEGEGNDRFLGYWNYATSHTDPLLLAEIPVEHPWQVFAWLPFGGWNECPGTGELMAVSAHWFRQHRAVPAVVTHDVLEYALPQPVAEDAALELAVEQYAFCPDIIDQAEDLTLGRLAGELACSRSWYFWWD